MSVPHIWVPSREIIIPPPSYPPDMPLRERRKIKQAWDDEYGYDCANGLTTLGAGGNSGGGGGAVFNASGYANYVSEWDANFLTDLYTDSAFTVPVLIDGNIVGGWKDRNGNTNPLSQSTVGKCPTYHTGGAGGYPFVQFNGTNNSIDVRSISFGTPNNFIVCRIDTWAFRKSIVSAFGGPGNGFCTGESTPAVRTGANFGTADNNNMTVGAWAVVYSGEDSSNGYCKVGTTTETSTGKVGMPTTWTRFGLGSGTVYSFGGNDYAYAAVSIARVITYSARNTTNRDAIISGLKTQYGI